MGTSLAMLNDSSTLPEIIFVRERLPLDLFTVPPRGYSLANSLGVKDLEGIIKLKWWLVFHYYVMASTLCVGKDRRSQMIFSSQ